MSYLFQRVKSYATTSLAIINLSWDLNKNLCQFLTMYDLKSSSIT